MMTYQSHCIIQGCKTTAYNKAPGVNLFQCPTSSDMRNKWLHVLRNKCSSIDWARSRICSKHFENKFFDSQRKLKENAIPTIFPTKVQADTSKLERLLNKTTHSELTQSIKEDLQKLNEPLNLNLDSIFDENLKWKPNSSQEEKLWLVIKKQEHLNKRLTEAINQNRRYTETLQKTIEDQINKKKDKDQSVQTYKYIIKCLEEKLATLEEQVEILTAVESV